MPLPRQTAVRSLLISLTLLLALAGGLRWNTTRLNTTEQELVGAWEIVGPQAASAFLLLKDRRQFGLSQRGLVWMVPVPIGRWQAGPESLVIRSRTMPLGSSLDEWQRFAMFYWNRKDRDVMGLTRFSADEIQLASFEGRVILRRSTNPELLAIFENLSAGNASSPPAPEAGDFD